MKKLLKICQEIFSKGHLHCMTHDGVTNMENLLIKSICFYRICATPYKTPEKPLM